VKKALSYVAIAILLGTVTMLAPLMLIKPTSSPAYGDGGVPIGLPKQPTYCPNEERPRTVIVNATLQARAEALERTIRPSNLSSAGLMLISSFFLALGISLYLKKRMF
jgi:hypothetical protein